ncbi:hypothetical protein PBCVNY2B_602R [Paramecium bursaria Chlorella virus NY2B]|uniref:Uncharacterized protein n=1 Tax=Paramecium bursaria Chlorella virus NYs1 TaxID=83442 RepID=M1I8G1_9PHYC|nr:hypothetical protein AR158_C535R [Paramecium bursaria Chlorella virus AR158]YP_009665454.1 hypothetical protein FK949_gp316 [Paramecium bursaria Chlorella virus NYs1]AGE54307.1 hypothetical protein PBCVIL52s1_620R [Paramecium bursaria Chlorella virus IL-5-2s1]AGE54993.1 hypothetical protein PBCVMA1D_612R [Paramecium bursaria Chlorella virus MA1D]AGE58424.1 hypothetical protein PBCVNY2B_602R [Paramecium bursaria Chlorella virus NY2B]ABU44080.1 hypothetical protein AR158_C535R [Paramecium bur
MEGGFTKTLSNVVNGVKALEDFTGIIIGAAIEDVLLCVARDYGLNYSKLVEQYKYDILDKHALVGSTKSKCKGFTSTDKPCGRRAVCRGYCRGHADQGVTRELNDRKAVDYAVKKKNTDPILKTLESIGAHITPVNEFMISKCDPVF